MADLFALLVQSGNSLAAHTAVVTTAGNNIANANTPGYSRQQVTMTERNPLTIEFLEWISRRPRTYAEAMEAWRTTCPRHSVWEDSAAGGLIEVVDGLFP